jgi:hypothetical protein
MKPSSPESIRFILRNYRKKLAKTILLNPLFLNEETLMRTFNRDIEELNKLIDSSFEVYHEVEKRVLEEATEIRKTNSIHSQFLILNLYQNLSNQTKKSRKLIKLKKKKIIAFKIATKQLPVIMALGNLIWAGIIFFTIRQLLSLFH